MTGCSVHLATWRFRRCVYQDLLGADPPQIVTGVEYHHSVIRNLADVAARKLVLSWIAG